MNRTPSLYFFYLAAGRGLSDAAAQVRAVRREAERGRAGGGHGVPGRKFTRKNIGLKNHLRFSLKLPNTLQSLPDNMTPDNMTIVL